MVTNKISQIHKERKPLIPVVILCTDKNSNYNSMQNVITFSSAEDALTYKGCFPVICHPPCAMFSKNRLFSKYNESSILLARHCYDMVNLYGGILEQPAYSIMFDYLGIKPTYSLDQNWFGYRARKKTWLYLKNVSLDKHPLSFDAITHNVTKTTSTMRARQPKQFCKYLINSVRNSIQNKISLEEK
jgi:hypothetical protein